MSTATQAWSWGELLELARGSVGRREARWLLEEVSGRTLAELRARSGEPASDAAGARFVQLLERRRSGEPLQHVLGHWSFRGLDLAVDGRALVPRPETEVLVDVALAELDALDIGEPPLRVVDLGTGSGAIALSIASERAAVEVLGTDRSPEALELAAINRSRLDPAIAARVSWQRGDWYDAVPAGFAGRLHCVVSNPPYLAEHELAGLDPVVRDFDPHAALVAGPTGLESIAVLIAGAPAVLVAGGSLVVELSPPQAERAVALAGEAGAVTAFVQPDLTGRARVLVARW